MANVLIIDDDEDLCHTLSGMVGHEGHDVSCAHTLRNGPSAAISRSFDVVFLDAMMPDGNGLDILPGIEKAARNRR